MKTRIIDLVAALKKSCILKEENIMEEFSISPAEYHGIKSILPGETISGGTLAAKMGLSVSRGSRVIEKLIRKGYLKHIAADDRRCIKISLTPKGLKLKKEIDRMLDECEEDIKSRIPADQVSDLINSLDKLTIILKSN